MEFHSLSIYRSCWKPSESDLHCKLFQGGVKGGHSFEPRCKEGRLSVLTYSWCGCGEVCACAVPPFPLFGFVGAPLPPFWILGSHPFPFLTWLQKRVSGDEVDGQLACTRLAR